jgi:hypothetical protein
VTGPRIAVAILAAVDVLLGCALIAGAPLRTAGPSFASAREIAPIPVWGAVILTLGALLAVAQLLRTRLTPLHGRFAIALPAGVAAGWHAFWAAAFLTTAVMDPRAALTGIPVYAGLSGLHLVVALMREEG